MSNEEKLQSLQRWQPALHMVGDQPFAGMDAEDYGEYVDYEAVAEMFESLCNSPEIDQIKPAGETGAEEDKAKRRAIIDAMRREIPWYIPHPADEYISEAMKVYGDLRAQEAVRDFAKMMEESYAPLLMYTKNPVQHERVYTMSLAESFINKHLKG